MPDNWSPATYLQFDNERTRAARDLLAQVPLVSAAHVVDLGCGPGNSTALLRARFPAADIVGVDSSPAMVAEATKSVPDARFVLADAAEWLPAPDTNLVFANALFQWIPEHLAIFPRLLGSLNRGGVLAVQMPDNFTEPTHRLMREVADDERWAARLVAAYRPHLPPVKTYFEALWPSASHVDIWHVIYNHVLDGPDAIVEWVSGTGLRPFLAPLHEEERADFLSRYRTLIAKAYPADAEGRVILRFPRLFIVAVR